VTGRDSLEDRQQSRLEGVRRGVCLEPERAVDDRDAQDGRPPPHVRLFELTRRLDTFLGKAGVDPSGRLGQPRFLDPEETRISGDDAGQGLRA
jgi:hypothetical protein